MIIKIYDIDWTDARNCWKEYRGDAPFDLPEVIIFKWTEWDSIEHMRHDYDTDEVIKDQLAVKLEDLTAFIVDNFDYKETTQEEFQSYWDNHNPETDWTINPQPYIEIAE